MLSTELNNIEAEFDKKVNELRQIDLHLLGDGEDSKIYDFGMKTMRGNEAFTVPDFGNIKSFLLTTVRQQVEKALREVMVKKNQEPFIGHQCQCGNNIYCEQRNQSTDEQDRKIVNYLK